MIVMILKIWREAKTQKLADHFVYMANKFGASVNNLPKLHQMVCCKAGVKIWLQFFWACNLKLFWVNYLARFPTTLDFHRRYLWNGPRYRKKIGALWSACNKVWLSNVYACIQNQIFGKTVFQPLLGAAL